MSIIIDLHLDFAAFVGLNQILRATWIFLWLHFNTFLLNLPEQCPFLAGDTSKPQVPEGKKTAIEKHEDIDDRLFTWLAHSKISNLSLPEWNGCFDIIVVSCMMLIHTVEAIIILVQMCIFLKKNY